MSGSGSIVDAVQQVRDRTAIVRAVRGLLKGSGLDIRELEHELSIGRPGHPDEGRIYISYIHGKVSHRRVACNQLGYLDGYGSDGTDEPPVSADTIIGALGGPVTDRS